jgi:hypothetical protein
MLISEVIQSEDQKYKNETVKITDGFYFSQYRTIQRINRYINNQFWSCQDPDAVFWNISNPLIPLFAKSIDLDSKDFRVSGIGNIHEFQAFVINLKFRRWVSVDTSVNDGQTTDNAFGITLDDTSTGITTYGSSVWKKVEKSEGVTIEEVNLSNLRMDPTVKDLIDSPVIEFHYMSETQIRNKWSEKADEIIEKGKEARDGEDNQSETTVEEYEIWERWGSYRENEDDDYKYMHYIGSGYGEFEVIIFDEEIKLDKDGKPKDFPYYDFHVGKYAGRFLRIGVVERLFELQEQANTLVNQNHESNQIASLLLMRTSDPETQGNILQSAVSGQIINSQDMQQIGIDNRFAANFFSNLNRIEEQARALCFITESVSGETPPSGVPFRSFAVASNASNNTFDYIKTSVGIKMGLVVEKQIMPSLVKKWNKEEFIKIAQNEDDIRLYDEAVVRLAVKNYMLDRASKGLAIFEEDVQQVKEDTLIALEKGERIEPIGKNFFDFKYGISMNPVGESVDKNAKNAAIDAAMQDMLANPAVVNTPLYREKLEINGISPFRLTQEEQQELTGGETAVQPAEPQVDRLSQVALQ